MSLEIFQKPEKVEGEKKLETIVSEESKQDILVVTFLDYFERAFSARHGYYNDNFERYKEYLKNFHIAPKVINETYKRLPNKKRVFNESGYHGLFLSAMIQTCYNQGFNDFEFEEMDADDFGSWLEGKEENPIIVKVKTSNGQDMFFRAMFCSLKTHVANGKCLLKESQHCSLIVNSLNGPHALVHAKKCIAEIHNYKGEHSFGYGMEKSGVYSPKKKVLEILQRQMVKEYWWGDNKFLHGTIASDLKKHRKIQRLAEKYSGETRRDIEKIIKIATQVKQWRK